jgi:hypothetical protein
VVCLGLPNLGLFAAYRVRIVVNPLKKLKLIYIAVFDVSIKQWSIASNVLHRWVIAFTATPKTQAIDGQDLINKSCEKRTMFIKTC